MKYITATVCDHEDFGPIVLGISGQSIARETLAQDVEAHLCYYPDGKLTLDFASFRKLYPTHNIRLVIQ